METTYESAIFQQSIRNGTSGFTRSSDQENAGLGHDGRYQQFKVYRKSDFVVGGMNRRDVV